MIQEIRVKNFLSIKNEVRFSFDASNDPFAEDFQVVRINDQTRLLRFAVVYGYNASGKTNILSAFDFLWLFWTNLPESYNEENSVIPFLLDSNSKDKSTSFELVFFVGETKYRYFLELDSKQVYSESLAVYHTAQPTFLFKRFLDGEQSKIDINPKLKISKGLRETLVAYCLKNMSFFAARSKVNGKFPYIDDVCAWFENHVMRTIDSSSDLDQYAKKNIKKDEELKRNMLGILERADFNIADIDVEEEVMTEDIAKKILLDENITVRLKNKIEAKEQINRLKAVFHHSVENETGKQSYPLEEYLESLGTLRSLGLDVALYKALNNECFLAIDELENSLHPALLQKLLFDFLKKNSRSQLLITTHYDGLLDLTDDLIRKDSVWFVEKNKAGISDFYKLTDFKGLNRISSIRSAYRQKRFGATQFSTK